MAAGAADIAAVAGADADAVDVSEVDGTVGCEEALSDAEDVAEVCVGVAVGLGVDLARWLPRAFARLLNPGPTPPPAPLARPPDAEVDTGAPRGVGFEYEWPSACAPFCN